MSHREPAIQARKISEVKRTLSRLVEAASHGETRVLIERSGIPVAALVSLEDLERLIRLEVEDRDAWEILEATRAPFRDIPIEEIEREIANAAAETCAERRAERGAAAKSA
jgi:prevent-host-death family protein